MVNKRTGLLLAGIAAGAVNGLFGAGGGMVLIPLLTILTDVDETDIFPTSVCIVLPICLVSLGFSIHQSTLSLRTVLPYLLGSTIGGISAGFLGKKIPTKWLHKALGILILIGGIRYLC